MSANQLPGVTFFLEGTQMLGTTRGTRKIAKVSLRAEIDDEAIWNAAHDKLREGLRVFTADDFKTELLNALREEHRNVEAENKRLKLELQTAQDENRQMKAGLAVLHQQIDG